jgi:hypothetical protein
LFDTTLKVICLGAQYFALVHVDMYGGDIVHKDIYTELLDALPEGQVQWSEAVSSDQTLPFSGQLSTKLSDV